MPDRNDAIKFWAMLTLLLLACAVAVTLIDLTIKAAILQEAAALREVINGQGQERSVGGGNIADNIFDAVLPADLLDSGDAGLETRNVSNGAKKPATRGTASKTKPGNRAGNTEVPPHDKPMGA